jgi:hypothetical protein
MERKRVAMARMGNCILGDFWVGVKVGCVDLSAEKGLWS